MSCSRRIRVWRTSSANTRATTSAPARRSRTPPPSAAWTSSSCCSITVPIRTCAKSSIAPKGKALYSAVYHGHYDIAKLLLERGAFPNPPVESSGSALWVSREWRPDKRMEELLLSYGAQPEPARPGEDWSTSESQLAAHLAAPYGRAGWRREEGEAAAGSRRGPDRARRAPLVRRRSPGRPSSVSSRW